MSTPTFDAIAASGNRGHQLVDNSWIVCVDGTKLSVIAGAGTYALPRVAPCGCWAAGQAGLPPWEIAPLRGQESHDYPGPYTHVEVMTDDAVLAGDDGSKMGDAFIAVLPVDQVRAYIEDHGGEQL